MINSNEELNICLHKKCPYCKKETATIYQKYDNTIDDFLTFYLCENCGFKEKFYVKALDSKIKNYEKHIKKKK